ncbi:hypothetical protein Q1695_004474 [Nippostrongylus brasiliensis]|nr:hypothetical protein Q1695_004474 [Nippostrongylus brasiliensis]
MVMATKRGKDWQATPTPGNGMNLDDASTTRFIPSRSHLHCACCRHRSFNFRRSGAPTAYCGSRSTRANAGLWASLRFHSALRRRNPAADGGPSTATVSRPWHDHGYKGCPTGFWCHEGEDESSYYCCPKNNFANRCHLPPTVGHGQLTMRRFYYDWTTDGCHELHYTGIGGNENSFMTYELCENVCRGVGKPLNQTEKISKNQKLTKKPLTTTTTIPSTMVVSPDNKESEAADRGSSKEAAIPVGSAPSLSTPVPRTSTGVKLTTPASMVKSGPFDKQPKVTDVVPEATEEASGPESSPESSNPCEPHRDAGIPGGIATMMWYFDESQGTCLSFTYLGIGGNANRFSDPTTCTKICGNGKPTRLSCDLPPQIGNGTYKIPRYYFSQDSKQCELFFYSGDGGNENRFLRKQKCERLCLSKKKNKKYSTPAEVTTSTTLQTRPATRIFQELHSTEFSTVPPTSSTTQTAVVTKAELAPPAPQSSIKTTTERVTTQPDSYPTLVNIPREFVPPFPSVTLVPAGSSGENKPLPVTELPESGETFNFIFEHVMTSTEASPLPWSINPLGIGNEKEENQIQTLPIGEENRFDFSELLERLMTSTAAPIVVGLPSTPAQKAGKPILGKPTGMVAPVGPAAAAPPAALAPGVPVRPAGPALPAPTDTRAGLVSSERLPSLMTLPGRNASLPSQFFISPKFNLSPQPHEGFNPPLVITEASPRLPAPQPQVVAVQPPISSMFYISNPGLTSAPGFPEAYVKVGAAQPQQAPRTYTSYLNPAPSPDPEWVKNGVQAFHRIVEQNLITTVVPMPQGTTMIPPLGSGDSQSQEVQVVPPSEERTRENPTETDVLSKNQSSLVDISPCHSPMYGDVVIMCALDHIICPVGTFCQIGDDQSICCPKLERPPCEQPVRSGIGPSSLLRWHFSAATRQCHPFFFHGFQGNENNFETLAACESTCGAKSLCENGAPVQPADGTQSCSTTSPTSCPPDSVCKISRGVGIPTRPECLAASDAGYGVESSHRWSFDSNTKSCVSFIYHGMPPPSPCHQPVASGYGNKYFSRFFYSKEYDQCLHFIYSGDGGNSNNFPTFEHCMSTCSASLQFRAMPFAAAPPPPAASATEPLCPHGDVEVNGAGPVTCNAVTGYGCSAGYVCKSSGGGDGFCCQAPESFCLQPRPALSVCLSPSSEPVHRIEFAYDPLADRCVRFSYSSCSPDLNLNHFATSTQCQRLCCNQGYDLVYKRRLLLMNDSPLNTF